jgi:hypothetical protein
MDDEMECLFIEAYEEICASGLGTEEELREKVAKLVLSTIGPSDTAVSFATECLIGMARYIHRSEREDRFSFDDPPDDPPKSGLRIVSSNDPGPKLGPDPIDEGR